MVQTASNSHNMLTHHTTVSIWSTSPSHHTHSWRLAHSMHWRQICRHHTFGTLECTVGSTRTTRSVCDMATSLSHIVTFRLWSMGRHSHTCSQTGLVVVSWWNWRLYWCHTQFRTHQKLLSRGRLCVGLCRHAHGVCESTAHAGGTTQNLVQYHTHLVCVRCLRLTDAQSVLQLA